METDYKYIDDSLVSRLIQNNDIILTDNEKSIIKLEEIYQLKRIADTLNSGIGVKR